MNRRRGDPAEHRERQRRFYASRPHLHLRPDPRDVYARRLVARVLSAGAIGREQRVPLLLLSARAPAGGS